MLSNRHFTCFCPETGIWCHKEVWDITGDRTSTGNQRLDLDLRACFTGSPQVDFATTCLFSAPSFCCPYTIIGTTVNPSLIKGKGIYGF